MAALTGVEPAGRQFSSVQLGLSSCVFGLVQFATKAFRAVRMTDVLPVVPRNQDSVSSKIRDSLACGVIPMLADRMGIIGIFLARVIQATGRGAAGCSRAAEGMAPGGWVVQA
jgi:hypothetical protein